MTTSPTTLTPRDATVVFIGLSGTWTREQVEFEEFAASRGPHLVRVARGLLKNPYDAEDVVQDVLARALVKWDTVSRADDLDAYTRRMVVNACTSFFRRPSRREYPSDESPLTEHEIGEAGIDDAYGERDRMLRLIRALPAKQRTVLVLRHYEDLSDAEIAAAMGCKEVTVRSNAARGLAGLRRLLEEDR